jgi:hypothetical protein
MAPHTGAIKGGNLNEDFYMSPWNFPNFTPLYDTSLTKNFLHLCKRQTPHIIKLEEYKIKSDCS